MHVEGGIVRGWVASGVVPVVTLLLAAVVDATHDVDHRYVVLGYVRDEQGRPVEQKRVSVLREKTGFSNRAETDTEGFCVLIVHLHDEDVLEWLQVTAGPVTIRIDARFNPLNRESPRGTRVDFRGGQAQERQEVFVETAREILGVGGGSQ